MNRPPAADAWIGHTIGDCQRYRLEKRLGRGGMGDVFLATDTRLGHQVALKLLKDTLVGLQELRKRFELEVCVCAALRCEHIVEIRDYGVTTEGYPFYVMEYLHGQTLRQLLQQQPRLPIARIVNIVSQVCEGLRSAHAGITLWRNGATVKEKLKVVHRDLKPDNIFLVPSSLGELAKILDFGIAKIRDSAEYTNLTRTFIGTFRYASPEQLSAVKDIDGRADIYSLGIILYEMLSGVDPFGFGIKAPITTGISWARAHTSKQPIPLRSQPGLNYLPTELEVVVMRCLQKSPNDRFASVDELNRALVAAIVDIRHIIPEPPISGPSAEADTMTRLVLEPQVIPATTVPELPTDTQVTADHTVNQGLDSDQPELAITQTPPSSRQEIPATKISQVAIEDQVVPQPPTTPRQILPLETVVSIPSKSAPSLLIQLLLPISAGFGIGLAVMGAIYTYVLFPQRATSILSEIQNSESQGKYGNCINQAETVKQNSSFYQDAQRLLNQCRLEYAEQLAASKNLVQAIVTARKIPRNSSSYAKAQALIKQWSKQVDQSI